MQLLLLQLLFVITTIIITNKLLDAINYFKSIDIPIYNTCRHPSVFLCLCEDLFMLSLQSISITQSTKCTQCAHNLFKGGQDCVLEITVADVNNELQMLTTLFLFPFLFFPTCPWHANYLISLAVPCWWRFSMIMLFFSMYLSLILQWWPDDCNNIPLITLLL